MAAGHMGKMTRLVSDSQATYIGFVRLGGIRRKMVAPMRDTATIRRITEVVNDTLSADFDSVKIIKIKVVGDDDFDDDFLRIEVIFEGARKDIDARKLSGAVRHVRPKLTAIGEKAFPLFSFISERDAGAGKLEPA